MENRHHYLFKNVEKCEYSAEALSFKLHLVLTLVEKHGFDISGEERKCCFETCPIS